MMGGFVRKSHLFVFVCIGVETILLLLCLKLKYPSRVTLIRGNHETRQITQGSVHG